MKVRGRTEKEFAVGDWVYLWHQPYRQHSLIARHDLKLSPQFFRPFQVTHRIGQVAYKVALPQHTLIHPIFHVLSLKRKLGQHISPLFILPPVKLQGDLSPQPKAILQCRTRKFNIRPVVEVLVQWQGAAVDDATLESHWKLQEKFPHIVSKVL